MNLIEIEHLSKNFGSIEAVRGISFTLARGEVLGFLGPNGAGKSTTMKMLAGFLTPSGGTARICGHDILTDGQKARSVLGYLPEGAPAYADMTVGDFLGFIARIRGFRGAEAAGAVARSVERLQLGGVLRQPIETLSKGFKRRVGLAQAILHDPAVLILDEPTDGLDPNQKHQVRQLIAEMAPQKAIIVSTHILEEVEAVCSRAMVIAGGRVLLDGTPAELEARSPYHGAVYLRARTALPERVMAALAVLPGVRGTETSGRPNDTGVYVLAQPGQDPSPAVRALVAEASLEVVELRIERGRLDGVFRDITQNAA